jgi:hypothetical protein
MDIEIDDQRLPDRALRLEDAGRHRNIVEDAEAGAEAGMGVMTTPRGVAGDPVLECQPGGQHRAGDGAPAAQHERCRQGQPEAALAFCREAHLQHGRHIGRLMRQLEPGARRRFRLRDLLS